MTWYPCILLVFWLTELLLNYKISHYLQTNQRRRSSLPRPIRELCALMDRGSGGLPAQLVSGTGRAPSPARNLTDGEQQRITCPAPKWRLTSQTWPVPPWLGTAPIRSSPAETSNWTPSWSGTRSGRCMRASEPTNLAWWYRRASIRCSCM